MPMSEGERIMALEMKVAFVDDALQQLSDEFSVLQKELQALKLTNRQLISKLQNLQSESESGVVGGSERPPHY